MKKGLMLIPLTALLLAGCTLGGSKSSGKKKKSSSVSDSAQVSGSKTNTNTNSGGGGGGGTSEVPVNPGASHALPWTLGAEDLYDSSKKGYAAYDGDYDFAGTRVTMKDVMVSSDPLDTKSSTYYAIQFRSKAGESEGKMRGVLTISQVKPTSVVAKVYVKKDTYTWSSSQMGTVKFGGNSVSVPGSADSEQTESYGGKLFTVTIPVNASADGDFVIENSNTFAIYIVSLEFKA